MPDEAEFSRNDGPATPAAPGPDAVPSPPAAPGPYPAGPYAAGPYPASGPYAAPGPYPTGPYPAPGPYPAGPFRPAKWNGFAITSFVLGLLSVVVFSVIFGILGLLKIRTTGQRGKGLAIAGLYLSAAWVLGLAIVVGLLLQAEYGHPGIGIDTNANTNTNANAVFELNVSDCFEHGPFDKSAPIVFQVTATPCTESHNAEVIGKPSIEGDSYPGQAAVQSRAERLCRSALDGYVMDLLSLPSDTSLRWYSPFETGWTAGQRSVVCFLANPDAPVTRSLREDATTLTGAQIRYLTAIKEFNDLMDRFTRETKWRVRREMCAQMAAAGEEERARLKAGAWPAAAQPAIDRLIAAKDAAIPLWRKANQATIDEDYFQLEPQAKEQEGKGAALAVAVRRALGLSTVQGEPPHRP